jgi:hypothetical protein
MTLGHGFTGKQKTVALLPTRPAGHYYLNEFLRRAVHAPQTSRHPTPEPPAIPASFPRRPTAFLSCAERRPGSCARSRQIRTNPRHPAQPLRSPAEYPRSAQPRTLLPILPRGGNYEEYPFGTLLQVTLHTRPLLRREDAATRPSSPHRSSRSRPVASRVPISARRRIFPFAPLGLPCPVATCHCGNGMLEE